MRKAKNRSASSFSGAWNSFSERHAIATSADSRQYSNTKKVSETAISRRANINAAPALYFQAADCQSVYGLRWSEVQGVCARPKVAAHLAIARHGRSALPPSKKAAARRRRLSKAIA